MKTCPKCEQSNYSDAVFCQNCGYRFKNPSYLLWGLGILLTLAFLGWLAFPKLLPKREFLPDPVENSNQNSDSSAKPSDPKPPARPAFIYTPPLPQDGTNKGVVELGAEGFNYFIVQIDEQKRWKLKKSDFGNSLVLEGLAKGENVVDKLMEYIKKILNYGVAGRNVHFVVSSGAQKGKDIQQIIEGIKSLGYIVNTVTAEQEGLFALQSVLPKAYEDRAFVVDIGSGNTKISWLENGSVRSVWCNGSKYYLDSLSDADVYQQAFDEVKKVPDDHAEYCFIIGGVPFQMAKESRQGKERFTVLGLAGEYEPTDEKFRCGLNIYQSIIDGSSCTNYIFDWDANFTIGFLLSLPYGKSGMTL